MERLPQPVHRLVRHRGDLDRQRFLTGIGGCPTQNLAAPFASRTPTFFYQFDDRHAPALNNLLPGYQWGAGHAMELAYLWPSFGNGTSLYDQLTPAQLELSHQMIVWWGAFTRLGAPDAPGQPFWPSLHQPPAHVAAPGRPEPHDPGGHVRGRAPVRVLERAGGPGGVMMPAWAGRLMISAWARRP